MAPKLSGILTTFTSSYENMSKKVPNNSFQMQCVDFHDVGAVICLLAELHAIVDEFKSHESIENLFIMEELRNRLKQRHIYNSAVCNCHNDNRLTEFFRLVCIGKEIPEESVGERLNFGVELQKAFTEFVNNFIPHMEEEEQVFQPLLVEHFEYAELKVLKEVVLEQHQLVKEQVTEKHLTDHPETNQEIKDLRDADHLDCSQLTSAISQLETGTQLEKETFQVWEEKDQKYMYTTNDELGPEGAEYEWNDTGENCKKDDLGVSENSNHRDISSTDSTLNVVNYEDDICKTPKLPPELLCEIFSYLNPPDMGHCAQVCWTWNAAVYSPALWKSLYPIQWARGQYHRIYLNS
ncbi:unnamed protein product, partial [Meganyctiphanes norvegica]